VGCGSGGYAPGFEGDGGSIDPAPAADSGIVPQGTGGAAAVPPVPSCASQPHGESSACRAVGAPYQFTCDPPPQGPGCKQVVVGSSTHMSVVYCCPRPEYP
jgi:hypothetical protein